MTQLMTGAPAAKTISEMATTYDVTLRTLRFYEDLELIKPLRIGVTRFYTPAEESKLQLILKGKRLGFSLAEIRRLMLSRKKGEQEVALTSNELELPRDLISAQIVILEQRRNSVAAAIDELKLALTG